MTAMKKRTPARGFTLLEAMMSSVIFLAGITGVVALTSNAGLLTRRGIMNTQLAQLTRDELRARTTGAVYPIATAAQTNNIDVAGVRVHVDIETFDTSAAAGTELPAQLPGCINLGYPSQCVRVTATDSVRPCAANAACPSNRCVNGFCVGPSGQYQSEAYVLQP